MGTTLALLVVHPRLGSIWGALMPGIIIIIYFCVPLRLSTMMALAVGYTLVVPLTWSISVGPPPTADDMYRSVLRMILANVLGFSVINTLFRSQRIQFAQNRLLQHLLSTDSLTGIANRRHFDHMLREEWRRCARNGTPLSLLMIDVDYFKRYNDYLGHVQGDECLRRLAAILTRVGRRPGDLVARYGGEEFVYLLPDTNAEGAVEVAERLRADVQAAGISHPASPLGLCVTVSIGVASAQPPAGALNDLVALADRALYVAKEEGRNRIVAGATGEAVPQPLQASTAA
jgi:diguanylate cyclase (GGDEF)-like protein